MVENANDDYHVRFVHRRNNPVAATMDTEPRWAGRTTSGYKPRKKHVDITGGRTDLPEKDLRGSYADHIYPNLVPLPKPSFIWMVRIDPITPERTRMFSRVYGLTHDLDEQNDAIRLLELANQEDTDMVTVLMEHLRSPFYRGRAGHYLGDQGHPPDPAGPPGRRDAAGARRVRGRRHLDAAARAPSSGRRARYRSVDSGLERVLVVAGGVAVAGARGPAQ